MHLRKTIIRLVALLLVCTLLSGGALALTAEDFSDVPADAWYYEDLDRLVTAGSINGVGEGRFAPDDPLTMAELLKLLSCLLWPGEAAAPAEGESWFAPHVALAEEKGLTAGLSLTTENIEAAVSRYDLAVVAVNAAASRGETAAAPEKAIPYISDYAQIPANRQEAVAAAYTLGLLQGNDSTGSFQGDENLTRCQVCAVAVRLIDPSHRPAQVFRSTVDYTGAWQAGSLSLSLEGTAQAASVTISSGGVTAGPLNAVQMGSSLILGEFQDSAGTRYRGRVYLLDQCLYLQLSTAPGEPDAALGSSVLTREGVAPESLVNGYYTAPAGADAPADALGLAILSPSAEQLAALGSYTDLTGETGCTALLVPRYVGTAVRITNGSGTVLQAILAGDADTAVLVNVCNGLGSGYYVYYTWSTGSGDHLASRHFPCDMSGASNGSVVYFQ